MCLRNIWMIPSGRGMNPIRRDTMSEWSEKAWNNQEKQMLDYIYFLLYYILSSQLLDNSQLTLMEEWRGWCATFTIWNFLVTLIILLKLKLSRPPISLFSNLIRVQKLHTYISMEGHVSISRPYFRNMLMYLIISPFVRCNISFFNFAPRSENMSMKIGFHKNVRDLFFSAAGIYICIAIKLRLGHWLSFWFLLNLGKVLAKLCKNFSKDRKYIFLNPDKELNILM